MLLALDSTWSGEDLLLAVAGHLIRVLLQPHAAQIKQRDSSETPRRFCWNPVILCTEGQVETVRNGGMGWKKCDKQLYFVYISSLGTRNFFWGSHKLRNHNSFRGCEYVGFSLLTSAGSYCLIWKLNSPCKVLKTQREKQNSSYTCVLNSNQTKVLLLQSSRMGLKRT